MKRLIGAWLLINLAVVGALGFRGTTNGNRPLMLIPDMDIQPRYNPQDHSDFFADGRTMRVPPKGAVAHGGNDYYSDSGAISQSDEFLRTDEKYYEGKNADGSWVSENPGLAKAASSADRLKMLERGRERFNIYCAVCHGAFGQGNGVTTGYGMIGVANYHDPRIVKMSDGEIYNTIVNGKGVMMPYGHLVKKTSDRWAIVAYIRALQVARASTSTSAPATGTAVSAEKTKP